MNNKHHTESFEINPLFKTSTSLGPNDYQPLDNLDPVDGGMELEPDMTTHLTTLINENGLIAVLETLKALVESRAEHIERVTDQQVDEQAKAFRDVANTLGELVETLPVELDIALTLEQLTHSVSELEPHTSE